MTAVGARLRPTLAVRSVYYITAVGLIGTGLGFILGPGRWMASPSYAFMAQYMPISSWAWVFVGVGVAKLLLGHRSERCYRIGSALGGTLSLVWAFGFIGAAITKDLAAWSAITSWLIIAVIQLLGSAAVWRK